MGHLCGFLGGSPLDLGLGGFWARAPGSAVDLAPGSAAGRRGAHGAVARGAAFGGGCGGPGCPAPGLAARCPGTQKSRCLTSEGWLSLWVGGSVSERAALFGSNGSRRMKMGWRHSEPLRHS